MPNRDTTSAPIEFLKKGIQEHRTKPIQGGNRIISKIIILILLVIAFIAGGQYGWRYLQERLPDEPSPTPTSSPELGYTFEDMELDGQFEKFGENYSQRALEFFDPVKVKNAILEAKIREGLFLKLPSDASPTRIIFPVDIDQIIPNANFTTFGRHANEHPEGFDYLAGSVQLTAKYRAMASGKVISVTEATEGSRIAIFYDGGLVSIYDRVANLTVQANDEITEGQEIGEVLPAFTDADYSSYKFWLNDVNRRDGFINDWPFGSFVAVSPYDYLNTHSQEQMAKFFEERIANYYKENGKPWPLVEPYLTNKIFIHPEFPGEVYGSWVIQPGQFHSVDGITDVATFMKPDGSSTNLYTGIDVNSAEPPVIWTGTFELDAANSHVKLDERNEQYGTTRVRYGFFEISEAAGKDGYGIERAQLKIEWSESDYPTGFSDAAQVYYERSGSSRPNITE